MRGLPSAIGEGRYERKLVHSASERSVGYVFLIEESVQNHPNPHPYQTGSKGFMPYCKYPDPVSTKLPFGRLIALVYVNNNNYHIEDAGYAHWIYGPGQLLFRMNERGGACLENNYGALDVNLYAWFIK